MKHAGCENCGSYYVVEYVCRSCGHRGMVHGFTKLQQERGLIALAKAVREPAKPDRVTRVLYVLMIVLALATAAVTTGAFLGCP